MSAASRPSIVRRPERLRRAMQLVQEGRVRQVGKTQFHVASGPDGYYVDLNGDPSCYCEDRANRNIDECKHSLASRLFRLVQSDPTLLKMLGEWIAATAVTK